VKQCIQCDKQVPDTAMHCVFCGAKQQMPEQAGLAKTVMGFAAADVIQQLKQAAPQATPAPAPSPQPSGSNPVPGQAPASGFGPAPGSAAPGQPATANAATLYAPANSFGPSHAPAAAPAQEPMPAHMAKTMAAPVPANLPPMAGPSVAPISAQSPSASAPSYPPQGQPGPGYPPQGQPMPGYPPQGQPMPGYPPQGQPMPGYPPQGQPMPGYPPQGQPMPAPGHPGGPGHHPGMTAQVSPQQPPYLASQTPQRMGAPQEPWAGTLETLMLIFGIALVFCFVLPWAMLPSTTFSWDVISTASGKGKLLPLLIAGTGVLAVVLSRLPLAMGARGLAAAFLGFTPIALVALVLAPSVTAGSALELASALTLIAGLLLRSEYPNSMLPRLVVTIGAAALLIASFIAEPTLVDQFKGIGDAPGKAKLGVIIGLMPYVLAVVGLLLTWMPTNSASGTHIIAWLLIIWPLVDSLVNNLALHEGGKLGDYIKVALMPVFWLPITVVAWSALTGYGVATALGKALEHD
jgi:hypothetical protein